MFDYPEIDKPPQETRVANINPYLVDAPSVALRSRRQPLVGTAPPMSFGSMANDGGHLRLSNDEKTALLQAEPQAAAWIRPFLGADEFINDVPRWCLWLKGCPPNELKGMAKVAQLVMATKRYREASARGATRKLADFPTLFGEDRQPARRYVLVPRHSSERRAFVPMGFLDAGVICGDANMCVADASLFDFGILSSTMHNAWIRYTCGRLESRYRYSAGIVYNNFPWPLQRDAVREAAVTRAAQAVLDARAAHVGSSLADLYDPNTMPPDVVKAHRELDRAVDAAYLAQLPPGVKTKPKLDSDAQRVAYLFSLYKHLTEMEQQAPA